MLVNRGLVCLLPTSVSELAFNPGTLMSENTLKQNTKFYTEITVNICQLISVKFRNIERSSRWRNTLLFC